MFVKQLLRFLLALAPLMVIGGCGGSSAGRPAAASGQTKDVTLLNVSYDPTRELWASLNTAFIAAYEKAHPGSKLTIKQSHGGSVPQTKSIIDGVEADVATVALWIDTDLLRRKKLVKEGWEQRLPHNSRAYTTPLVFVVRKGNPKGIKDWPDLVKPGIEVITPNPKTSGNGKIALLAAWGSVVRKGGTEDQALEFLTKLYKAVPKLDTGARGSTTTFATHGLGDVHLTWESEAYVELEEARGALEIVYPSQTIRAEPFVTVVDANVDRKKTRAAAEEYLQFLFTPEGQEIIARHHFRPMDETVLARHKDKFRDVDLYVATDLEESWDRIQEKFFAEGGVFDSIYSRQ